MIILSAGGKRMDWFEKRSQDELVGVDAITDEQLKGFAAPVTVDVEETEVGTSPESTVDVSEETTVDIPGTVEDESLPSEGGDLAARVADVVDDVAAVQEKLQDVADDVKDVADLASGDVPTEEVDEVEIEVEDVSDETDVSEDSETEGEGLSSETVGDVEDEDDSEEDALIVASDKRTFVRVAALSGDTKKQVQAYWTEMLGYDPEYVKLMIKDFKA
jgi:hypothetical protein